jgi:hypothetical protein
MHCSGGVRNERRTCSDTKDEAGHDRKPDIRRLSALVAQELLVHEQAIKENVEESLSHSLPQARSLKPVTVRPNT